MDVITTTMCYSEKIQTDYILNLKSLTTINAINRFNRNPKVIYIEGIFDNETGEVLDSFDEFKCALDLHIKEVVSRGITTLVALVEPEFVDAFEKLNFVTKYKLLSAKRAVMVREVV